MRPRPSERAPAARAGATSALALVAPVVAASQTDLQQIEPLVWLLVALSTGGALITFAILFYALWRFKDPTTRGRRYG